MTLSDIKLKKKPWYELKDFWIEEVCKYMRGYSKMPKYSPHFSEIEAFEQLARMRLVFESNLIEGAGLSLGETRNVIENYFPKIPDKLSEFRGVECVPLEVTETGIKQMENAIEDFGLSLDKVRPSFIFGGKSRKIREVSQHYYTIFKAQLRALQYRLDNLKISVKIMNEVVEAVKNPLNELAIQKLIHEAVIKEGVDINDMEINEDIISNEYIAQLLWDEWMKSHVIECPPFITVDLIKDLHKSLANGLMPKDAHVPAGEYRIDTRSVDYDLVFLSPNLIQRSMEKYVSDVNDIVNRLFHKNFRSTFTFNTEDCNLLFLYAAEISYKLVRIHPFPDFNGRLSRIILIMFLNVFGVPFALSLRGDKKGKHRYLRALKFANNGNLNLYAALITMNLVEYFREIDTNLDLAGLPSILTFDPKSIDSST